MFLSPPSSNLSIFQSFNLSVLTSPIPQRRDLLFLVLLPVVYVIFRIPDFEFLHGPLGGTVSYGLLYLYLYVIATIIIFLCKKGYGVWCSLHRTLLK